MIQKMVTLKSVAGELYLIVHYFFSSLDVLLREKIEFENKFLANNMDIETRILFGVDKYVLETVQKA